MTRDPAVPLHPQARALITQLEQGGFRPLDQLSVLEAREANRSFPKLQGPAEPVGEVRDVLVAGAAGRLPARVYIPTAGPGGGPPDLMVWFHGGGWVTGDIGVVDRPCRALANATGLAICAVEYRLSPETKFPGPVEDCYAATGWVSEHAVQLGAGRLIGAGGDSAGGNLTAAVTLMARDRDGPVLDFQVLVNPALAPRAQAEFPSYRENGDGYLLTAGAMAWCWDHYLAEPADGTHPYAAPLRAASHDRLPAALVATSGFDPLRDEGEAYARLLAAAGVPVTVERYDDMIHGFFWLGGVLGRCADLIGAIARFTCAHRTATAPSG